MPVVSAAWPLVVSAVQRVDCSARAAQSATCALLVLLLVCVCVCIALVMCQAPSPVAAVRHAQPVEMFPMRIQESDGAGLSSFAVLRLLEWQLRKPVRFGCHTPA